MKEIFLKVFSEFNADGKVSVPLETLISLCAFKFCNRPPLVISCVVCEKDDHKTAYNIDFNGILFNFIEKKELPRRASLCQLPVMVMNEGTTCVAGLCAVIRHVFKTANELHPFLGFKQSCLYACAETSLWTKFCEVDALKAVEDLMSLENENGTIILPEGFARFEMHMSQPVRAHNIQKVLQDMARSTGVPYEILDVRLNAQEMWHKYAEGVTPTIADIILLPCIHIAVRTLGSLGDCLPLTSQWYNHWMEFSSVSDVLSIVGGMKEMEKIERLVVPHVPSESLYKSDPKRYKPRHRIFTRQDDVEASLAAVSQLPLDDVKSETFGLDVCFDWDSVPWDAQPSGGALPEKRVERKSQQLENLVRAVLKIAKQGDRIVDFCAGSGHLGLILAHSLPRCTVVLLENKEESLGRARERARKLHLSNIVFCQSNVNYFLDKFDIGVALHACGVATDLVMHSCIIQNAAFVCCPCCYGGIQPNHTLRYPRSRIMQNCLSERDYLILGHAADQTHDAGNTKTEQGNICMDVVDADRCWQAQEMGYKVFLSKLLPATCTPKNNLLVGVPHLKKST